MNMIPRKKPHLVVVGNGMAGMRTLEELLARAPDAYDISVFGAEPHPNYNRILLSSVLAGEKEVDEIVINPRRWYEENRIALHTDEPVTGLDAKARTITTERGRVMPYDTLLLATGSKPLAPPIPGLDLPGVCSFRDIGDVDQMIAASRTHRRAVVVGGGLLGLEAAWGLKRRGMAVAVVHLMPTLMERQLDRTAGELLQRDLDGRGIAFFTNGQTEEIYGENRVEGVRLADGRDIPADLVVMAIGIRPEITLAKQAGLDANRGIVVGDDMRTTDPHIYAVGECAEHRGQCFGLVAPLWDMAKVCADRLAGIEAPLFAAPKMSTRLKITGIDLFSAGVLAAADESEDEITFSDAAAGIYKKLVIRDDKLVGAVLYGDVADGAWYFDLMCKGADVASLRPAMIFGSKALQPDADPAAAIAQLPDEAQICGCNGVSKGAILGCIKNKGLTGLDEVRAHSKASASCGSCTPQVAQLLALALGNEQVAEAKPTLCKCTDKTHEEVRHAILAHGLKSMEAVRQAMGWTTPDGCAKCRPALNYYLLCAWPGEYRDDSRSRFVNERVHANIQKDGTYSVVPRMWGGLTNPKELRAIADVAEKYRIPTVKVTGGQRIDLLGVKKQDLPGVWADLNAAGMVSGHAYAKGLRTVKTCVGSEWCRFGTQDSTGLGVKLEKMMWGAWTPHKVKLAVSGCPRNCAEASIKDIGIVCIEAGYDILVGGNGGIELRATDKLTTVASEEEVLEHAGAFLQLYREEARYLDRTAHWVARAGIGYVKERVVADAAGRKELYRRFLFAQSFAQVDPWAERAAGADAHEFKLLATVE
jgi:nitrite reductase (NADH) large subunit